MFYYKCLIFFISLSMLQAASIESKTLEADIDGDTSFAVAKCRQRCFIKTHTRAIFRWGGVNSLRTVEKCHQMPDCYMCYDYCEVLTLADEDLASAMCSDEVFCSQGCRIACNYHRIETFSKLAYEILNNS